MLWIKQFLKELGKLSRSMLFNTITKVSYISARIYFFTRSQGIYISDIIKCRKCSTRENYILRRSIQMKAVQIWWQRHCRRRSKKHTSDWLTCTSVHQPEVMRSFSLGWRGRLLGGSSPKLPHGGPIPLHCGVGFMCNTDSSSEKNPESNHDLKRECEKEW